jgi:DNA-binding transcriptional ArsR family regulator
LLKPQLIQPYELLGSTPESAEPRVTAQQLPISLAQNAGAACELLKSMAHEGRLTILYLLSLRERSVTELEEALALRQPAVSQQLARLRSDRLVTTRRDGKMIYYSLANPDVQQLIDTLVRLYASQSA